LIFADTIGRNPSIVTGTSSSFSIWHLAATCTGIAQHIDDASAIAQNCGNQGLRAIAGELLARNNANQSDFQVGQSIAGVCMNAAGSVKGLAGTGSLEGIGRR
jgi:hypothetical protein